MGWQNYIGFNGLGHQCRRFPLAPWLFIFSNVSVGPTVKRALFDGSEVIRNKIITQPITLLHRGPKHAIRWIKTNADRIAKSSGQNFMPRAIGIVNVDCSTVWWVTGIHI